MEKCLVEHCAPTLAGLKAGSLFSYFVTDRSLVQRELKSWNFHLNANGIYLELLKTSLKASLIYVYRKNQLIRELVQEDSTRILTEYGYTFDDNTGNILPPILDHLRERLVTSLCFPHEIGLFLSYPASDVEGFIKYGGKNCLCCGPWKVYCNKEQAEQTFAKYKKCQEIYNKLYSRGRHVRLITVSG